MTVRVLGRRPGWVQRTVVGVQVPTEPAARRAAMEIPAGLAFLAMAFVLGIGTGGVFAWVDYTVGLILLCVIAAVAFVVTLLRITHEAPTARRQQS